MVPNLWIACGGAKAQLFARVLQIPMDTKHSLQTKLYNI